MITFLRLQFRMGKLTEEQLFGYVPRWLTQAEAQGIMDEER